MKKIFLLTAMIVNIAIAFGQTENGIHFEKGMNWGQILAKAKAENKYIFVDCYATWCGPCKWMDANVYTQKEVGDVYNVRFVCIKVQMDRTAKDDSLTKILYGAAGYFTRDLRVKAYPTFLFFSPDGKPLHKVTGSLDAKQFIQMAAEAQNPDKQYYTIVKNFRPGTLDTAEEKSLARLFKYSDKELAAKVAFDYLSRIPKPQLSTIGNGQLMVDFQDNIQILTIAIDCIQKKGVGHNRSFVLALSSQPRIKALAVDYIFKLDPAAFGQERNLKFIENFDQEPQVQQRVKTYVASLPNDSLYTKKIITLLNTFTEAPDDLGFDVFYHHSSKVDMVMQDKSYSQSVVRDVIRQAEFNPAFAVAKKTGKFNFDSVATVIRVKYNKDYADEVIINGKVSWYNFQVYTKKDTAYWPQLIESRIAQIKKFRQDTIKGNMQKVYTNNTADDIFLRSDDQEQLETAIRWMKEVVKDNPKEAGCADTYACLLYKTGKTSRALEWERRALQLAKTSGDKDNIKFFTNGIEKMKKGKKIWMEKEYVDN